MSWTDERVELLKKMWAEGQSASQIAKELGSVTRNAVIGKVHRLGLSNRVGDAPVKGRDGDEGAAPAVEAPRAEAAARPAAAAATPRAEPRPAPQPRPAEAAAQPAATPLRRTIVPAGQPLPPQPSAGEISPEALASVREVEKRARKISLMELTERTCKWPIGDPSTDDFWFCGLPSSRASPIATPMSALPSSR